MIMKKRVNWQTMFCFGSLIFIITCICWYGGRFIKFYLDNNNELVSESTTFVYYVLDSNRGSGNFKKIDDKYYFYGDTKNNYVSFANMLWRIVKINEDDSILLVSDSVVGTLAYGDVNSEYGKSKLINWLNNEESGKLIKMFYGNKKYLKVTSVCVDDVTDMEDITCFKEDNNYYLGLLSIEDYLVTGGINGFINNNKYSYLANKNGNNEIWYINDKGMLDTTKGDEILGIKTTITLSNLVKDFSGNGTIDDPYVFDNDTTNFVGSYVNLDGDIWRVYEESDDTLKLVFNDTLKVDEFDFKYHYSTKDYYHNDTIKGSLAYYLNNTFYDSLSYKDLIIENTYINGLYGRLNNYDSVSSKMIETKVSIPSIDDIIFNDTLNNYFTNTGKDENLEAVYVQKGNGIASAKLVTSDALVIPCISIKKENLTIGSGSKLDPYGVEE